MQKSSLRNEQVWLAVGSLMILATVTLAFALVYMQDVMVPFVLSIFVTVMVSPVFDFQVTRWHVPKWIAVLTTLLLVLAMLALMGYLLIVAIQMMVRAAGEYSSQVIALTDQLLKQLNDHLAQLNENHVPIDRTRITNELGAWVPGLITRTAGTATTLISRGFLIVIFVVFLLIGRNVHQPRTGIYAEIASTIRNYITTMTAIAAVTALLVGSVLWGLGLQMAWLFGLLVFLLNFIPNIGSIVATLLPIPVAVTQFQDPWMVLAVVAIPGAIHLTIGNLIAPRLMGRGVELHPVTVLLALAFWGLMWGIVGMVLAVPIVGVMRIVLSRYGTTRPLAELLAGRLPGTGVAGTR
jgi:AI-2 transport protein TqsA